MSSITKNDLLKLCKQYKIEGLENLTKKEILEALEQNKDLLEGSGIFDSIGKFFKKGIDKVKDIFSPRLKDYNNISKRTLKKFGNLPIKRLSVYRTPLSNALNTLMNAVSFGKMNELKKKYGYDKFFHLALIATVNFKNKDRYIVIEKEEDVTISEKYPTNKLTEMRQVNLKNQIFTINQLVVKTRSDIGDNNFFKYSAFSLNCQRFIMDILETNNLLTPTLKEFILQDIKELAAELPPNFKKLTQTITDIGAVFAKLTGKGELKGKGKYKNIDKLLKIQEKYINTINKIINYKGNKYSPLDKEIQNIYQEGINEGVLTRLTTEKETKLFKNFTTTIKQAQKAYDFYPTPQECINKFEFAIKKSQDIFEPTAGLGHMLYYITLLNKEANITALELYEPFYNILSVFFPNVNLKNTDYLEYNPPKINFDCLIINPPFTNGTDKRYYLNFLFHSLYLLNKIKDTFEPSICFISPSIINESVNSSFSINNIFMNKYLSVKKLKKLLDTYKVPYSEQEIKELKEGEENLSISDVFGFVQGQYLGRCVGFGGTKISANLYLIIGYYNKSDDKEVSIKNKKSSTEKDNITRSNMERMVEQFEKEFNRKKQLKKENEDKTLMKKRTLDKIVNQLKIFDNNYNSTKVNEYDNLNTIINEPLYKDTLNLIKDNTNFILEELKTNKTLMKLLKNKYYKNIKYINDKLDTQPKEIIKPSKQIIEPPKEIIEPLKEIIEPPTALTEKEKLRNKREHILNNLNLFTKEQIKEIYRSHNIKNILSFSKDELIETLKRRYKNHLFRTPDIIIKYYNLLGGLNNEESIIKKRAFIYNNLNKLTKPELKTLITYHNIDVKLTGSKENLIKGLLNNKDKLFINKELVNELSDILKYKETKIKIKNLEDKEKLLNPEEIKALKLERLKKSKFSQALTKYKNRRFKELSFNTDLTEKEINKIIKNEINLINTIEDIPKITKHKTEYIAPPTIKKPTKQKQKETFKEIIKDSQQNKIKVGDKEYTQKEYIDFIDSELKRLKVEAKTGAQQEKNKAKTGAQQEKIKIKELQKQAKKEDELLQKLKDGPKIRKQRGPAFSSPLTIPQPKGKKALSNAFIKGVKYLKLKGYLPKNYKVTLGDTKKMNVKEIRDKIKDINLSINKNEVL